MRQESVGLTFCLQELSMERMDRQTADTVIAGDQES